MPRASQKGPVKREPLATLRRSRFERVALLSIERLLEAPGERRLSELANGPGLITLCFPDGGSSYDL